MSLPIDTTKPHNAPHDGRAAQYHQWANGPDPTHGPCGVRTFEQGEAVAITNAERWVYVGLILGALALGILVGTLAGNGTIAGWLS